jgi:hypothetical protein
MHEEMASNGIWCSSEGIGGRRGYALLFIVDKYQNYLGDQFMPSPFPNGAFEIIRDFCGFPFPTNQLVN